VAIALNGAPLSSGKKTDPYVDYAFETKLIKQGTNQIEITLKADGKPKVLIQDVMLWLRRG
jgi:hypothetical protein